MGFAAASIFGNTRILPKCLGCATEIVLIAERDNIVPIWNGGLSMPGRKKCGYFFFFERTSDIQ